MGLFSKKTTIKETAKTTEQKEALAWVIKGVRVTEKAALLGEKHVFTFDVSVDANKKQISDAVHANYNVKPLAVNTSNLQRIHTLIRGKKGKTSKTKKAYVTLDKKDTINLE